MWRIVALQCCICFCYTAKWISYMYTHFPRFLDFLPIWATTKRWVEFPVLHNRFLTSYLISSLSTVVCICQSQYPNSSHPPFSPWELILHQKIRCCRSTQSHVRKIYSTTRTRLGCPQGSVVKNSLVMQETRVRSLGSIFREDPLKKEMATQSSILAWEIPWAEDPGGLQFLGFQKSQAGLSE